jgi:flagellar basal-body rod protein FlgG
MMRVLSTAATGMLARETEIAVVSNNLANISTTAFQKERAEFADLLYVNEQRPGDFSNAQGNIIPTGIQIGLGVKTSGTYRVLTQGELMQTNNTYDLAIIGNGYFRVQLPDGTNAYTRAGSFRLSPAGEIVTDQGFIVTPGIVIPPSPTSVNINDTGQVQVSTAGNVAPTVVGQVELADFPNAAGLLAVGDNLFVETPASGGPIVSVPQAEGLGTVKQGWLEASNVNPINELTTMITAQRGYELCSKAIQAGDEMMQTASRIKS